MGVISQVEATLLVAVALISGILIGYIASELGRGR